MMVPVPDITMTPSNRPWSRLSAKKSNDAFESQPQPFLCRGLNTLSHEESHGGMEERHTSSGCGECGNRVVVHIHTWQPTAHNSHITRPSYQSVFLSMTSHLSKNSRIHSITISLSCGRSTPDIPRHIERTEEKQGERDNVSPRGGREGEKGEGRREKRREGDGEREGERKRRERERERPS